MLRFSQGVLSFVSGVCLAVAFPKGDLSLLAWVAFVPLLWVVYQQTPRQAFVSGWLAGMGFYLCTLY
jgi:apolipoprotein N-acyltransferase